MKTDPAALGPRVLRVVPGRPDPQAISSAAAILRAGGLIGFPTETFYGLGADALNSMAISRVFQAKGRAVTDPIALVIGDPHDLAGLVERVSPGAKRLIACYWPGPLTLVFTASNRIPSALTAGTGTIGIRVSSHPVARALLARFGGPVTATSANRSGASSPGDAGAVIRTLGPALDLVLDAGPSPGGLHSTVVDVTGASPRLIRVGAIPFSVLTA